MAKNILLTTLSTLHSNAKINYYYGKKEKEILFCNGISQQEAGSKYILSTVPIDKIVVIGSEETNPTKKDKLNTYAFYQERINDFLAESTEKEQQTILNRLKIDDTRIEELQKLVKQVLLAFLEQNPNKTLSEVTPTPTDPKKILQLLLDNEQNLPSILSNIISKTSEQVKESIDASFEQGQKAADYNQLIQKHTWHTLLLETERKEFMHSYESFKRDYWHFAVNYEAEKDSKQASFFEAQKKKIEDDASLSSLGRQYSYMQLKEHMDTLHTELLQKDIFEIKSEVFQQKLENLSLQEKNTILEKELLYLQKENEKLQFQLQVIHSHRKENETAYAKYYIFQLLDTKNKWHSCQTYKNADSIMTFVYESVKENTKISTAPENNQLHAYDNLLGLVNALYTKNETETIHLYIDMQGGSRTSGYVRNAVLSILTNQTTNPVFIKQIVATKYEPQNSFSEIADETARYKIIDLASGMNAFIRYGKADIMETYCASIGVPNDAPLRKLVNHMVQIDYALSLCDMNGLTDSIEQLRDFFKEENNAPKKETSEPNVSYDAFDNIYQVLKDGIRMDYGVLLKSTQNNLIPNVRFTQSTFQRNLAKPTLNMLELIDWACCKGFIQQALTLIESKMPEEYFDRKWLVMDYQNTHPDKWDFWDKFMKNLGQSYETENNRIFYLLAKQKKPHSMANVRLIRSKNNRSTDFETQKNDFKKATDKEKAQQFAEFWIQYQTQRDGGTGTRLTNTSTHPLLRNIANETNGGEFNLIITNILNHDNNNQYRNIFSLNHTDFNEYLKQQLLAIKNELNSLHETLLPSALSETTTTQEAIALQERFLFLYCKFCTLEKYLDKKGNQNSSSQNSSHQNYMEERMKEFTFEQFYHVITIQPEDTLSNNPLSCSATILSCLNRNDYLIYAKDYANELKAFCINLHTRLNTNATKRKLEDLFLLHQALKIERNCNNHASQKGIRLPKPVVERAIKLYVEKFKEIQNIIDRQS